MFVAHCLGIQPLAFREGLIVCWRGCKDVCSLAVLIRSKGLLKGCEREKAICWLFCTICFAKYKYLPQVSLSYRPQNPSC